MDSQHLPFLKTVGELQGMKFPPSKWVVEGLLRCGRRRISLLNSLPKSGKSTLARQLATCVAKGRSFLGRNTSRVPVLYWQTEDEGEDLQESFNHLGYNRETDAPIYTFHGSASDNTLNNFDDTLIAHPEIELVIIETLDDLFRVSDLLSNTAAREAFEKFDAVFSKHAHRVACLALHHLKKTDNKSDRGKDILGATVLRGRTDAEWFLYLLKDEDSQIERRMFEAKIRRGCGIEMTFLDYDAQREFSTLGESYAAYKAANAERTNERINGDISRYFANHPGSPFEANRLPLVVGNSGQKRRSFRHLLATGRLVRHGKGTKGEPFVYSIPELPADVQSQFGEAVIQ